MMMMMMMMMMIKYSGYILNSKHTLFVWLTFLIVTVIGKHTQCIAQGQREYLSEETGDLQML